MWSTPYLTVRSHTSARYNVVKPQVIVNPQTNCVARDGVPGFDVDVTRVLKGTATSAASGRHATYAVVDEIRCSKA